MAHEFPAELEGVTSSIRNTASLLLAAGAACAVVGVLALLGSGGRMIGLALLMLLLGGVALWAGFRQRARLAGYAAAFRADPVPVVLTLSEREEVAGEPDLVATFTLVAPEGAGHEGVEEHIYLHEPDWDFRPWLGFAMDCDAFAEPDSGEWKAIRTPHGWLLCGPSTDVETTEEGEQP
jgi:hypothetical protein